jgi:hypothetical protein
MQDYEKLGVFYLGKEYDLEARKVKDDLLLYDSKDLVTHAVVLGMTGSGKTGLCIGLIEEATIDGVPSILIDPKGDLCNLLLTFPNLSPEDFLPWINQDDARQKGLSLQDYAAKQAKGWADGLASWGEDGARIQRLRDAADFRIYTPASGAGIPVSIMKSFSAPPFAVIDDAEMMRERISTTVTSLLGLIGIEADPVQSREFILLSTIIDNLWRQGRDLDLAQLITYVQNPPVTKIGVLDLDSFYPPKDRFALVMALNNLLASPGFSAWLEGEPLDIGSILYTPQGKPRVAIFSIAHLNDAQRMFFVSLLLNQILGWMRSQPGTTSLRALLYIDEIFGYLPPLGNPPSKTPLLTLLKQARAFGLGLVLATQNPVDLDYKALSNAGTWFIGRLQAERDKARVLDGLEGAAAATGSSFDRRDFDRILSGLGSRVFLCNNTHDDQPVIMTTRWVMSYLPGPLTREQIRTLMAPVKAAAAAQPGAQPPASQPAASQARAAESAYVAPVTTTPTASTAPARTAAPAATVPVGMPPALPPEIPQFYVPARGKKRAGCTLVYKPRLMGAARVSFADTKSRISENRALQYLVEVTDSPIPVEWENAEAFETAITDLEKQPEAGDARYANLPSPAGSAKNYAAWTRDFGTWLYGSQALELFYSPGTKAYSKPGEAERDFRVRIGQGMREQRDDAVDALRKKYAPKITTLQERMRRAKADVEKQKEQARNAGLQTAVAIGSSLLGAFTGRKIKGATTAARGIGRSMSEKQDINRAEDTVEALEKQLADLNEEFKAETDALATRIDPATEELQTVTVKPKKADIIVNLVALAWVPYWQDETGSAEPAF